MSSMRRTSQSMYQPNNKPNNSKIGNSNIDLLQNKSALNVSGLKVTRKVQGHDLLKTTKTNFQQTVNQLKNKPNQKGLEDEYINGLQEEIKYLEYELKLLKDKEILERQGVNQLDNFLKDQIPINENILAMKNKYNATKAKLEDQLQNYNMKNNQAADVLATQKNEIDRLHQIIDAHRKQKNQRREQFKNKVSEIVKEISLTIDQYKYIQNDNREMMDKIKKMNEDISVIHRQNEKEKVVQVRANEEKSKKAEKFEEKNKLTKQQMIETTQQCQQLDELEDRNPLLTPLQQQNSFMRKKIMLNDKQRSTAENTIAEITLLLNEEEREREIQRQHKQKYINSAEQSKLQIQQLEREGQNLIREATIRAKKVMIKEMNHQLQQKEDIYDLLTDRLRNLEQQCSNLIQEKKELTDLLDDYTKLEKQLSTKTNETTNSISSIKSTAQSLKRVTEEVIAQTRPVESELEKTNRRIPTVEKQIEKKNTSIHYLNKQIDLLKELKSLDLEQLQMISTGGRQIQNLLSSFIQNWEKIKSQ